MASVLAPGGWAAVEIDTRAAEQVGGIGREAFGHGTRSDAHPDLSGRSRVISFDRAGSRR
jgi:hypothetical protein